VRSGFGPRRAAASALLKRPAIFDNPPAFYFKITKRIADLGFIVYPTNKR
jgi:hypothetical protein